MKNILAKSHKSQSGVLLIEAMVAILIFTIGVIALMGVQAAAVRSNSDAKIRMDAEFFADQLLSEMAVDGRDPATNTISWALLRDKYALSSGGGYMRWKTRVLDVTNGGLPNAGGPTTPLTVVVTQAMAGAVASDPPAAVVAITIQWLAPNDPTATPRKLVTTSVIRP